MTVISLVCAAWASFIKSSSGISTSIDIELPDDDFRRIALQAHERDITFNKMALLILKDGLQSVEDGFEREIKPQLLNEDKWYNLKPFVGRTF